MIRLISFLLASLAWANFASAQSVTLNSAQTLTTARLTAVACNAAAAARWTGWIPVSTQRNVVFDVDFVDANASAASVDVRCEGSTSASTVADAGRDLPVITATATTGISLITISTLSWVATGGGAPGTSSYELYIENIPAPFVECLFTCGGAAADNITVASRGINP